MSDDLKAVADEAARRAGVPVEMFKRQMAERLPSLTPHYGIDCRSRNAVVAGDCSLRQSAVSVSVPDLGGLNGRQFRMPVSLSPSHSVWPSSRPVAITARHQPMSDGMDELSFARRPFEVGSAVMRRVAVEVVDFMLWRRRAKEGHSDESVHEPGCSPLPHVQGHIESSLPVSARAKDMPGVGAARRPNAANTATVADFVPVLEADDGAPFFGRGTLAMHRESPSLGVTPPAVCSSAGVLVARIIP